MNIIEARQLREKAEHAINGILNRLQFETGLDIAKVEVILIVDATGDGDPKRRAHAVRIDLAV
jgi:hypothetical protein